MNIRDDITFVCIKCGSAVWMKEKEREWECRMCGTRYPVRKGVHCFLPGDQGQKEKEVSDFYSFMWGDMSTMEKSEERVENRRATYALWFGLEEDQDWKALFGDKVVLDAGAGCGMAEHLFIHHPRFLYAVELSRGIESAARYWQAIDHFIPVQADIFHLPFPDSFFDVIFSVGVLHHTYDTRAALKTCVRKLKEGGRILFYIYRRKSSIREFADNYIRERLSGYKPGEVLGALTPLTRLGEALQKINEQVYLPQDIPELAIKAGYYSVYDLVHWHLMGCFWSPFYSLLENLRVNVDWYYPRFAHRHSAAEVWEWLDQFKLTADRFRTTQSGIAVIARKNGG